MYCSPEIQTLLAAAAAGLPHQPTCACKGPSHSLPSCSISLAVRLFIKIPHIFFHPLAHGFRIWARVEKETIFLLRISACNQEPPVLSWGQDSAGSAARKVTSKHPHWKALALGAIIAGVLPKVKSVQSGASTTDKAAAYHCHINSGVSTFGPADVST